MDTQCPRLWVPGPPPGVAQSVFWQLTDQMSFFFTWAGLIKAATSYTFLYEHITLNMLTAETIINL